MSIKHRPEIVQDKHLNYLDVLRDSGITNMWGAGTYLEDAFNISEEEAKIILIYWMKSFNERHTEVERHGTG